MSYVKTEEGQAAFRERSALFSARQRAAFIMFDGVKPVEQVLAATASLGITRLDIEHMVAHGLLKELAGSGIAAAAPVQSAAPISTRTPQERYCQAKPLATQLTASLGLRGFMLNLGVESASGYDDLLALFPKIQTAVGAKKCEALEQALKG